MKEEKQLRDVYCKLLIEAARRDDRIVLLEADLQRASGTMPFKAEFPDRTFDVGIAEANMITVAAGLAAFGKKPFANSFATFATRRCFDQICISGCYSRLGIKICGTDPGITAELNGGTHMSFEDAGIMRVLPDMVIVEPVDSIQLKGIFDQIIDFDTPVYIRLQRKEPERIFNDGDTFRIGKSVRVREGRDCTIFASGIMVSTALQAAEELDKQGYSVRVENMFTLKPVDRDAIAAAAKDTGAIVTSENHTIINGLGSAVAETVCEIKPVPVIRVGVKDRFGEVGKMDYLRSALQLDAGAIIEAVKRAVSIK